MKGLAYLHGKNKIHRDIKAANIFINLNGVCKLGDFGVSAELKQKNEKRKTVVGSPYWMPPEMITNEGYTEKADIWSIGVVCFELAEGAPPYYNLPPVRAMFMIPKGEKPQLSEQTHWSFDFKNFVSICLERDVDKRPQADSLLKHPLFRGNLKKHVKSLINLLQPTFKMPFDVAEGDETIQGFDGQSKFE